jgi:hypothetical protein
MPSGIGYCENLLDGADAHATLSHCDARLAVRVRDYSRAQ